MQERIFNDLTSAARDALARAEQAAAAAGRNETTPDDLLGGLLGGPSNRAQRLLTETETDLAQLRAATPAPAGPAATTPLPLSLAAQQVLADASKEARLLGHGQVDALHILFGLLYDPATPAAQRLQAAGVTLFELRTAVKRQKITIRPAVKLPSLAGVIRPSWIFMLTLGLMLANGGALLYGVPDRFVQPCAILFIFTGWVVSLCLHEFGHALAAYLGGDAAVKDAGYLTLNPLKYSHPLLSIILPIIMVASGGIGLPGGAVYIQTRALRGRGWQSFVSAAGPLGTLIFTLLIGWPFFFDWTDWITDANFYFWPALGFLVWLQISSLVLNLLPIPPLDGFGILAPLFSWELRLRIAMAGNIFMLLLFMVLSTPSPISGALWDGIDTVSTLVGIPADLAWYGRQLLYHGVAAFND